LMNVTNGGGPEQSPSWSPDGTRIAFARQAGNSDIYTIGSDGSGLVRLTDYPSREYSPSWSADGKYLLFGSSSGSTSEILIESADGGKAVPLTDSAAHKTDFAWSPAGAPGGERIAFTMLDGYNQGDVFVMAVPDETGTDGSGWTNLTQHPAHDCCVAWAPDGKRILFLSSRNGKGAGRSEGRQTSYPSTLLLVRAGEGSGLRASPDVVRPLTTVVPAQPRDVYVIDSDGGGLTNLTSGAGNEKHASWSPGGERIAFVSDRDGNDEIYVMAVPDGTDGGGKGLTRLTDSPEDDSHPTWSPDGRCLAFESYRDGALGLYVMHVDGSGLKKLADSADWGTVPSWSP
ncbi:hypothetical protein ACFLYD_09265, partial [Chloroflexota bacterium]